MQKIMLVKGNTSFGITDPIFNLDISYYIFQKPVLEMFAYYFLGIVIGITIYMTTYYIIAFNRYFDGVELIRKIGKDDSFGLTFKLLTTKEGKKMGKTEKGALWLDPEKTSPYEFYQYWRNIDDKDVKTVLSMLTFLPMDEIEKLTNVEGEEINKAKKIAAFEITKLVHGEEAARKAEDAANNLFMGKGTSENVPETKIEENSSILDAIIKANFATSKSQAKTLVMQGGISLNDEKIADINYIVTNEMLEKEPILKKGKKGYTKLVK